MSALGDADTDKFLDRSSTLLISTTELSILYGLGVLSVSVSSPTLPKGGEFSMFLCFSGVVRHSFPFLSIKKRYSFFE